ncbi:hypothetical protein [Methylobacterium sp. CM6257]|jgi:hypothetical protein
MRFAVLTAVLSIVSLTLHAEEASTPLAASCAQTASDLQRQDLGCPNDEVQHASPDHAPSD